METPHDDCTCCRHWRVVETLSYLDMIERERRIKEGKIIILNPRGTRLLPPRPQGVDLALWREA